MLVTQVLSWIGLGGVGIWKVQHILAVMNKVLNGKLLLNSDNSKVFEYLDTKAIISLSVIMLACNSWMFNGFGVNTGFLLCAELLIRLLMANGLLIMSLKVMRTTTDSSYLTWTRDLCNTPIYLWQFMLTRSYCKRYHPDHTTTYDETHIWSVLHMLILWPF